MDVSRRKFVFGSAALLCAIPIVGIPLFASRNDILDYIPEDLKSASLGKMITQQPGFTLSDPELYYHLSSQIPSYAYYAPYLMRRALKKIIQNEYAQNQTLMVRGWLLPKTIVAIEVLTYRRQHAD